MQETESRLIRLEEGQYFQETLLKDLDSALRAQQNEINQLEHVVASMRTEILILKELLAAKGESVRPPHYLPEEFRI